MRLPSHSYDKNDLARSLSVAVDGPEEVIEAEDYLQPTPRASVEIPTTPVSSKVCLLISSFPLYWKSIFYNFFYHMIHTRVWVMLKVMIMHCNAVHIFKVMSVMCNATNLAL